MEPNKEVQDRIFTAADSLYAQLDHGRFPTVDDVRKLAKVNMNDASSGMKEWRRARTAQPVPAMVRVPDGVQKAGDLALSALWSAALEVANENLRALQGVWGVERAEAETLNRQLADAHESQAGELAAALARVAELERSGQEAVDALTDAQNKLEEARNAKLVGDRAKVIAEQRADEIQRRADDLRMELDRAHLDTDRSRAELVATQSERDQAMLNVHTAQINAAELRGRIESLVEQQTKLFAVVQPAAPDKVVSEDEK
jgi:colicin import membrane protein